MEYNDAVIVTGSSGFIGSALINKLAGRFSLVGLDRVAHPTPPPGGPRWRWWS
jgi:nucleoside-diphosphate-sugar epimerase